MKINERIQVWRYKFSHWFFRWTVDNDGAITLTIANVLNLTKYKEHTIVRWGKRWPDAPKYVQTGLESWAVR